jgi:hypothetical protein
MRRGSPSIGRPGSFTVGSLVLLLPLAVGTLVGCGREPTHIVEALIVVRAREPSLMRRHDEPLDQNQWSIEKATQAELVRSYFVLQSAIRDPKIAGLPLIASQDDPIEWLEGQVEVSVDGEVLTIAMRCTEDDVDQTREIVDAIVEAYNTEVLNKSRATHVGMNDVLTRRLHQIDAEIDRAMGAYIARAQRTASSETPSGQVLQQLDVRRIERVDDEIMRLENELSLAQTRQEGITEDKETQDTDAAEAGIKWFEQRIESLTGQRIELEKKVLERSQPSLELATLKRELESLQEIRAAVSARLQQHEVDSNAPPRIFAIQPATASPIKAERSQDGPAST